MKPTLGSFCLGVAMLLTMVACGSNTRVAPPAPTPSAPTATVSSAPPSTPISGAVSISGQFLFNTSFTAIPVVEIDGTQTPAPSNTSCSAYAAGYPEDSQHGGGTGFDPPPVHTAGTPSLYLSVSLPTGYHGPGTYDSTTIPAVTGVATVAVGTAQGRSYYVFNSHGGTITFTVAPDGSGSLYIANWLDDENRGGNGTGSIAGNVTWTCQ